MQAQIRKKLLLDHLPAVCRVLARRMSSRRRAAFPGPLEDVRHLDRPARVAALDGGVAQHHRAEVILDVGGHGPAAVEQSTNWSISQAWRMVTMAWDGPAYGAHGGFQASA